MEGIPATNNTIFVDTTNTRVDIATSSYRGNISTVGLYISSNSVFSNTSNDNCVIYSSGSVTCKSFVGDGSGLTNVGNNVSSNTWVLLSHSSGTILPFAFTISNSSATYEVSTELSVSSGTTSASAPIKCTVNGDSTASHYVQVGAAYPSGTSNFNNQGTNAWFDLTATQTGSWNVGDISRWTFRAFNWAGALNFYGPFMHTYGSLTVRNIYEMGAYFKSPTTPYIFTCTSSASGFGVNWDVSIYISSGITTVQGPVGPQGATGSQGPTGPAGSANISGTTNKLIKFTAATTGGDSSISDNGTNITVIEPITSLSSMTVTGVDASNYGLRVKGGIDGGLSGGNDTFTIDNLGNGFFDGTLSSQGRISFDNGSIQSDGSGNLPIVTSLTAAAAITGGSLNTGGLTTTGAFKSAYRIANSSDTLSATFDHFIVSTGTSTLTLPTAVGNAGLEFVIKNAGTKPDPVTLIPNGSEKIDGAVNFTSTTPNESISIFSDGANWNIY